jgi:hypothetical protein
LRAPAPTTTRLRVRPDDYERVSEIFTSWARSGELFECDDAKRSVAAPRATKVS